MATRAEKRAQSGSVGIGLLEQFASLRAESLSVETALRLLEMDFDASEKHRFSVLSGKAQEARLLPDEQSELDEYLRVADLLAILQSRARQALKLAGLSG